MMLIEVIPDLYSKNLISTVLINPKYIISVSDLADDCCLVTMYNKKEYILPISMEVFKQKLNER